MTTTPDQVVQLISIAHDARIARGEDGAAGEELSNGVPFRRNESLFHPSVVALRQFLDGLTHHQLSEVRCVARIGETQPSEDRLRDLILHATDEAFEGDRLRTWLASDDNLAQNLAQGLALLKNAGVW